MTRIDRSDTKPTCNGRKLLVLLATAFGLFQSFAVSAQDPFFDSPATPASLIELRQVHLAEDLVARGCDTRNGMSLQCNWASHVYCQAKQYAGGYGPVEYSGAIAIVVCVGTAGGVFRQFSYQGQCTFGNPSSLFCTHQALYACLAEGYAGSTGVIGANAGVIATMCLTSASRIEPLMYFNTLNELQSQNAEVPTCNYNGIVGGTGCQNNAHRFCKGKGYGTGFNPSNFNGYQLGTLVCADAQTVVTETRAYEAEGATLPYRIFRPAKVGTRMMGGMAHTPSGEGSWLTHADVLQNTSTEPLVITNVELSTTFPNSTSSDACFFHNDFAIYQSAPGPGGERPGDGGELMCTYSGQQARPSMKFGQFGRGVILNPGDKIMFQSTPQWKSPAAHAQYSTATVTFAPVGSYIPMSRIRFPRWDSAYGVANVHAGCGASCTVIPTTVPPGKPRVSSNDWYLSQAHATIRGISVFVNKATTACVRVVAQGGANVREPYCFSIQGNEATGAIGPDSFDEAFGAQQTGSSFVPLDIDVPAGMLVGIDFSIWGDGGDFAGYVWFE